MFTQKYTKYKAPGSATEKVVRAISDILPMPCLNYNLNKVFEEPKRIARGNLITCPAKKPRIEIESYLSNEKDVLMRSMGYKRDIFVKIKDCL